MTREDYKRPVKCPPSAPTCASCNSPKHPCPQNAVFNCCTGAGINTGRIEPPFLLPPEKPIPLACATLDTTCLCKPIVKVTFSCKVNFILSSLGDIVLSFQLEKSCDNGQDVICGTWTLTRDSLFSTSSNDSFEFAFCDCNPCPSCCTYSVKAILDAETGATASIAIDAPTIKAIAMETCKIQKAASSPNTSLYETVTGTYGYQEVKCQPAAPVCANCEPKHPCPQGVIFNCCTGAGLQTTSVCPDTPRSLVCVTIDTTCLCRPLIALDFSAIIAAAVPDANTITLIFQVKKSCDNGQKIDCGSWTFERTFPREDLTTSDSLRFTFCDCNPCPSCCTYSVELASCNAAEFGNGGTFSGSFSINAPTAAILAVDICPQS